MRYTAKEYRGDRPCIDPLTMAELRLRCAQNKAQHQPEHSPFVEWLARVWRLILP
jgi:hypothetical protein